MLFRSPKNGLSVYNISNRKSMTSASSWCMRAVAVTASAHLGRGGASEERDRRPKSQHVDGNFERRCDDLRGKVVKGTLGIRYEQRQELRVSPLDDYSRLPHPQ